jgi:LacI family transcriptional regulator
MRITQMKKRPRNAVSASARPHLPRVLLFVETSGAFGRDVIKGIGRWALENGPWSIQYEYRSLESLPPQWFKQWNGDGIISRTVNAKQAKILQEAKLPLVELHGHPQFGISQVNVDVDRLAELAVEHFWNCGLRQFGFFTFGDAWWIRLHLEAYCRVLQGRGHECRIYQPPTSQRSVPAWHESQRTALIEWISALPRPIGIYTVGDIHSVRLLDVCHELDIAVPEEIAILGLGNDDVICETVRPTLSSIDVDARRIGYEAAGLLSRMMAGKPFEQAIVILPSHVVVRQSTDLIAIEDPDMVQALRLIRESACTGIDVGRVAEEIGLSRRALEQRFRKLLGRTPKAEIMRIQIEHAKMLLAQTHKTSESIAHKSGFSSLEYFTRIFRRKTGMKPQAYRKMRWISRDVTP